MKNRPYAITQVRAIEFHQDRSWLWIGTLLVLIAILSLGISACSAAPTQVSEPVATLPAEISVDQAYDLYQDGVFFLDVRTPEEWDDFHAPNSTLIPLDQLEGRLGALKELFDHLQPYPLALNLEAAGLTLSVSGTVADFENGEGLNLRLAADDQNTAELMKMLQVENICRNCVPNRRPIPSRRLVINYAV